MARAGSVQPYRWLAEYYDEFFGPFRSPQDKTRESVLGAILPGVRSACDLACGTGTTALEFARRGIRMYAVDLSPVLCRITRRKAKAAGLRIQVFHADMRKFRLPEKVDLVTCEADALNHVPRAADLALVAKAVARALRPGGHFYFEVNNSRGFKKYWSGMVWFERPGAVLVMRNGHNSSADQAWSDVEWFIQAGRTAWRRQRERVEEVCWPSSEIRRHLRNAGFGSIRALDPAPFFGEKSPITRGCRTVYLAKKMSGLTADN